MKIIHVDDHPMFSESMGSMLRQHNTNAEVISLSRGREALTLLDEGAVIDLIFLDLDMPDMKGITLLEALQKRKLSIPVIVISGTEDLWEIRDVMEAGAAAFIPKSSKPKEFLGALEFVMSGKEAYIPIDLKVAISRLPKVEPSDKAERLRVELGITDRVYDVLKLMQTPYKVAEIAQVLHLSPNTIKSHTSHLYRVLNVNGRSQCVNKAIEIGLLSND